VHLLLRFARDAGRGRQLEHRRLLALAQTGDQDDLPVGEFQGVVVRVRAVHVAVAGQTDGRAVSDGSKTSHEKALHEQFGQPWHEKNMPHTERHIERNVLDIHVRANDGAQNLEIYARCFQWEQKFASLNSNASRRSSNASRSRTRDREIALGAYRSARFSRLAVSMLT
jgi:hypothetical protein